MLRVPDWWQQAGRTKRAREEDCRESGRGSSAVTAEGDEDAIRARDGAWPRTADGAIEAVVRAQTMPAIGCSAPSRRGQLIGLPSDCPTTLVLPAPLQSPTRPSPDFLPPPRLPLPLIFKSSPWPSLVPPLSFLPVRPRAPTPSLRLFRRAKQSQCRPPSATSSPSSPSSRPPSLPSRRAPSPCVSTPGPRSPC